jgi:hypothetical protein
LSSPKNVTQFYPFAVHIIYAVIVTLSFEIASRVLVPFSLAFSSYDAVLRSTAISLSYFLIISGWVGYSKSISKRPHGENRLGIARFVVDLLILYLAFYLLNLTDPLKFKPFISVFNQFLFAFPLTFIFYIIWDILKYLEYKDTSKEQKTSISRTRKTVYAFALFAIQYCAYSFVIVPYYHDKLKWGSDVIWEEALLIVSIVITFFYRRSKWVIPETTLPKKPRKRSY